MTRRGIVIVVSAPSGGGKGTILAKVVKADPQLSYSVSTTTRTPRSGEVAGNDYVFVDEETFLKQRDEGAFIEWAEVHGAYYGTPKKELLKQLDAGFDVILEVDVQGMRQVRELMNDRMVSVFIETPSMEELEKRLRDRGGLDETHLQLRLRNAAEELKAKEEYDFVVMNDELENAVHQFEQVLVEARARQETAS